MREIEWYFPKELEEAKELIIKEGIIPHGGGTGIIRSGMSRIKGLIDLKHLPIHYFHKKGENIKIGATQTFTEVSDNLEADHILSKALSRAASTPLRNRITLGGSIALFPAWSDLMGPLIALDTEVSLMGEKEGSIPIVKYITKSEFRKRTLITGINFKNHKWLSYYYRETRSHFDYPAFTITILIKRGKKKIEDAKIVLVGCVGKFKRFYKLEEYLKGKAFNEIEPGVAGQYFEAKFTGKKFLSSEYIRHLAGIHIERGLESILRS